MAQEQHKADEQRERVFFGLFKKLVLRIGDDQGPIYLIRYSIFECKYFAIKIHRILLSDDDCLHDHPWSFLSIILWGGYTEHSFDWKEYRFWNGIGRNEKLYVNFEKADLYNLPRKKTRYGFLNILWRPNPWPHRLEINKPTTTLVITFNKVRTWGFYTKNGWVEWMKYIRMGRPCE